MSSNRRVIWSAIAVVIVVAVSAAAMTGSQGHSVSSRSMLMRRRAAGRFIAMQRCWLRVSYGQPFAAGHRAW